MTGVVVALTVGTVLTVTSTLEVFVHPFTSVIVTMYVCVPAVG